MSRIMSIYRTICQILNRMGILLSSLSVIRIDIQSEARGDRILLHDFLIITTGNNPHDLVNILLNLR